MNRLTVLASLAAVFFVYDLSAADSPAVATLKAELKTIKEQEKVALKTVHEWYTQFIKRDKWTDAILREQRLLVANQEDLLLAVTVDSAARRAIRSHFDTIRTFLTIDIRLDDAQISRLRLLRAAHEDHIKASYSAKIAQIEAQIKVAAAASKPPKK